MPHFTIETTYGLPVYGHRTYEAETPEQACRFAIEDDDWSEQNEDYESCGETVRLQERGRVVFSSVIDGSVYAKHGTTIDTRLLWVSEHVPPRLPLFASVAVASARSAIPRTVRAFAMRPSSVPALPEPEAAELAYETVDWTRPEGARLTDALYEGNQRSLKRHKGHRKCVGSPIPRRVTLFSPDNLAHITPIPDSRQGCEARSTQTVNDD